ncbi:MAG TPA: hypothetical protein VHC20_00700 [Candidatus Paceibacterota bacterium]|nr:hypothetical protein [Candidatus Paceibacterota bacterium]
MIGNNEVRLNAASMMQAVQDYLNKDILNPAAFVEVTSVTFKEEFFVCRVKGREPAEDKQ